MILKQNAKRAYILGGSIKKMLKIMKHQAPLKTAKSMQKNVLVLELGVSMIMFSQH